MISSVINIVFHMAIIVAYSKSKSNHVIPAIDGLTTNITNTSLNQQVGQPWWQIQYHHGPCGNKTGQKKYFIQPFYMTNWYEAYMYCRHQDMQLASITSQKENDDLAKQVSASGLNNIWTSGTDKGKENQFHWMATGRLFTYQNWLQNGQPDNKKRPNTDETDDCVAVHLKNNKLVWYDQWCSESLNFVCEVET